MIDEYIRQYGTRLFGLCLTLCGNRTDAEDLYQETWLRAVRSFPRYDSSRAFEPWLTKICVNVYRSSLRRPRAQALEDELPAPARPDYLPLYEAIDKLPEKLRLAVILFYFRDMDLAQTARALNLPPGTVKSRLNRARNRLKEVLTDETDLQF